MDLNNNDSNDSLNYLDSPLETPKVKPDSPLSYRVKGKIDEVFEEEEVINENKELIRDEKINKTRCKSMKEIINCDTKHKLKDYINEKKRKLDQSKRILELKYANYKSCNDFWNIGTIVLSSCLTLIESSKLYSIWGFVILTIIFSIRFKSSIVSTTSR